MLLLRVSMAAVCGSVWKSLVEFRVSSGVWIPATASQEKGNPPSPDRSVQHSVSRCQPPSKTWGRTSGRSRSGHSLSAGNTFLLQCPEAVALKGKSVWADSLAPEAVFFRKEGFSLKGLKRHSQAKLLFPVFRAQYTIQ